MKYMSSKFNYFAPKKTMQHSAKSNQYTFNHCTRLIECFKDGRIMSFCMQGSRTWLIKWCVKWCFLKEFDMLHFFFEIKEYFGKKKTIQKLSSYPSLFYLIFDPCWGFCHIYGKGLLNIVKCHVLGGSNIW